MGFLTCRLFREGCSDTVTLYLGEELSRKKQAVQRPRGSDSAWLCPKNSHEVCVVRTQGAGGLASRPITFYRILMKLLGGGVGECPFLP